MERTDWALNIALVIYNSTGTSEQQQQGDHTELASAASFYGY